VDLSRGAQRLLALIESYARRSGQAFPFQKQLANRMDISEQMVRRYLLELKRAGRVVVQKRGQTSALYLPQPVQVSVDKLQSELRSELRSDGSASLLLSEAEYGLEKQAGSLPLPVEKKPPRSATLADLMPPVELVNEYGRRDLNPEYARVRDALLAARWRISSARNPAAYERAIIERERAG